MGKKGGSKGKGGKGKVSASKLANKHLNKLARQGKLKNDKWKKKLKERRAEIGRKGNEKQFHVEKPVEEERELQDEDLEFYGTPKQHSFVANVKHGAIKADASTHKGKKRKIDDVDNTEQDYERLPRKMAPNKEKMMLPIKTKHKIVPRIIKTEGTERVNGEAHSDEELEFEDGADDDNNEDEEKPEPLPVLSGVELYAQRQKKLRERKDRIGNLANAIVENPEVNMKKLRDLVHMLEEKDPDVYVTVRKYTMISLLEIFKDIIPGYYIRLPTDKEKHQKMKKETKAILDHEIALVRWYKEYLEFLEKTAKGEKVKVESKKKKKKKTTEEKEEVEVETVPKEAQTALRKLAVSCLCELLNKHPHFNYTSNIIVVIVPYMNNGNKEVSDIACDCVKQAFQTDKTGYVTLEITKTVGKMIKARDYKVKPRVLDTFLSLRIKEVSYTDPIAKKEEEEKKQHGDKLSRREKKLKKKQMFLERDLEETRATYDKKRRLKLHTETIQVVFLTYFRILKKAIHSVLLPSVLEGLAKFAHLINVDFFDDLFAVFNKLIAEEELSYRESLHCVQTAFTILSGQGSVLNIDPVIFYKHLYKNLYHVHAGGTSKDVKTVIDCLDIMVNKRKRQVSQQRVLAFTKRLMTLSLQQTAEGTLGLLAAIRSLLLTYSYTDILLDNDSQGSGTYLPDLEDPEHCNAHNAMLWELSLLKNHCNPTVQRYSRHLCHGAPTSGEGQLPPELRKSPGHLMDLLENQDFFDKDPPTKQKSSKHKYQRREGYLQPGFSEEMTQVLDSVIDMDAFT